MTGVMSQARSLPSGSGCAFGGRDSHSHTHSGEPGKASSSASRKEGHSGLGAEFLMHSTIDILQQFLSIIKQKAQGECVEE